MSERNKRSAKLGLILGVLGLIAGIILLFGDSWLIGIFGSIASAGLTYKGYQDSKILKNE
jgi:uncharacterized membrane protein HdeD (DUF308 family)